MAFHLFVLQTDLPLSPSSQRPQGHYRLSFPSASCPWRPV